MRRVLNQFVYQKGGWTLHMLRYNMGTERFWDGIREYYRRYQNQNASTDDLRAVMERASGKDLRWFFDQWLTRSGVPALTGSWRYDAAAQTGHRRAVAVADGRAVSAAARSRNQRAGDAGDADRARRARPAERARFTFAADAEPSDVVLDPNTWVLMETPTFVKRER